jgi:outer membrane protein TolC
VLALLLTGAGATATLQAQAPGVAVAAEATPPTALDLLLALALRVNPEIQTAAERVTAARARIPAAGTLPDPMLSVGVMNLPLTEPGFGDLMTMSTVGVGQRLPFPGKLPLEVRLAEQELHAAEARQQAMRREVTAGVRTAYYELAFLDGALETLERSQRISVDLARLAESRYRVGAAAQPEVLEAGLAAVDVAREAAVIVEARGAVLADLNALLDRPSETPVEAPRVPERLAELAVSPPERIRFASTMLGARANGSPLPSLTELQERALRQSPEVRAHAAEIATQALRVELAGRAHLPDFDLSLQYGYRLDRTDMVSLMVSVPLPVHRAARQDAGIAEARAELAGLEAEHRTMANEVASEVARLYAEAERERAQLALLAAALLPRGRAVLAATTSAYEVGTTGLAAVLESQAALLDYEIGHLRALTEFAKRLAELERIVGEEVIP